MTTPIAIIGAGVIGLTTGIRLREAGYPVTVFARQHDAGNASRGAPALWIPYKAAPEELILQWAKQSLAVYENFSATEGVRRMPLTEYYRQDQGDPLWSRILTDFQRLTPTQMPDGYVKGFQTHIFRIDTGLFMDYLARRYRQLQGEWIEADFRQLENVDTAFPLIINCSGVWSRHLVPDEKSFPIRGQYMLVEKPEGLDRILFAAEDDQGYSLIVPREHDCYLGGTTLNHDWDTRIRPDTTQLIRHRAEQLEPRLIGAKVLHEGVCLRPGREAVRLEREALADGRSVIHNYGHGGSGFTVGWGCAETVVRLVASL